MRQLVSAELYTIITVLLSIALATYAIYTYTFAALLEHFWWLGPAMIGWAWIVSYSGSATRPPRHSHKNRRRK